MNQRLVAVSMAFLMLYLGCYLSIPLQAQTCPGCYYNEPAMQGPGCDACQPSGCGSCPECGQRRVITIQLKLIALGTLVQVKQIPISGMALFLRSRCGILQPIPMAIKPPTVFN